jgi:hypothetical protein
MTPSTQIPATLTRGDTLLVLATASGFPTPDYTISFSGHNLSTGEVTAATNAAANSGGAFLLTIASAATATWPIGALTYALRATDGTNSATFQRGVIQVTPGATDTQTSTAAQIVRSLDAAILARVQGDEPSSYSVEGLSVTTMSLLDLRTMRDRYASIAQAESGAASGVGTYRRILGRVR